MKERTPKSLVALLGVTCLSISLLTLPGCRTGAGSARDEDITRIVNIPIESGEVKAIGALPQGECGVDVVEGPVFKELEVDVEEGFAVLEVGSEPIWLIEGYLPEDRVLGIESSPFGFHPASAVGVGYEYAEEIGVEWDRAGLYFMWVLGQPDLNEDRYDWTRYDRYFVQLPAGFMPLKNITVAHDQMVERPGSSQPLPRPGSEDIDVSRYLVGTSYVPSDPEAYAEWVKAVVERYDGDGVEDMPGLGTDVKYWQVDNEPPRGREGYSDLVRITSQAIKGADPEAKVLIGGLVAPYGAQVSQYERESLPLISELDGEGVDIFDFHWFGLTGEWRFIPEALTRVRADLEANGFADAPIWFTEMGTYSGNPSGWSMQRLPVQTEREQAAEMVKRYTVALGEGVEKIFWAWGMIEGFSDTNDNDFFDNTGFVYDGIGPDDPGKGVKKLIYWTYREMADLLSFWDGSLPEKIDAGEDVAAYRFPVGAGDGRGIVVLWLNH